jgi:organic radical activating enzyme
MTKQLNFDLSEKPPRISQWFVSLEGEGNAIGTPSLYIRLAGCYSAACTFCDTKFSWGNAPGFKEIGDRDLTLEMNKELIKSQVHRCTITGGEPLHYMTAFPDIFRWVNQIAQDGIDFIGIESNGNLLQDEKHCLELLKSFNEIDREYGVLPTLTISPKIDAKTCYDKQMTQEEVDKMYFTTFRNIADYLQPYDVFYKFIYEHTEKIIDFEHQKIFIDYLIDELIVPHNHILLMPFTPEDPLGKDKDFWEKSKDATSRKALELGVNYSPRIHIDRKLD